MGTKCVDDNFKMLVTVLAFLVTNIHYLFTLASGTNTQKMSPASKFSHQHPQIVTNFKSPTSLSPLRTSKQNLKKIYVMYDGSINWMPPGMILSRRMNPCSWDSTSAYGILVSESLLFRAWNGLLDHLSRCRTWTQNIAQFILKRIILTWNGVIWGQSLIILGEILIKLSLDSHLGRFILQVYIINIDLQGHLTVWN